MLLAGTALLVVALVVALGLWSLRAGLSRAPLGHSMRGPQGELHRLVLARGTSFERLREVLARLGIDLVTSGPEAEPAAACWVEGSDRLSYVNAATLGLRTLELEGPRAGRLERALLRRLKVVTPDRLASFLERTSVSGRGDEPTVLWAVAAAAWQARSGPPARLVGALQSVAISPLPAAAAAERALARLIHQVSCAPLPPLEALAALDELAGRGGQVPADEAAAFAWRSTSGDADRSRRTLPN